VGDAMRVDEPGSDREQRRSNAAALSLSMRGGTPGVRRGMDSRAAAFAGGAE